MKKKKELKKLGTTIEILSVQSIRGFSPWSVDLYTTRYNKISRNVRLHKLSRVSLTIYRSVGGGRSRVLTVPHDSRGTGDVYHDVLPELSFSSFKISLSPSLN